MLATISLDRNDIEDTINTLTFAKGVKTIKNPIEMNKVTTKSNVLNCLYIELSKLEKDLLALRSSTGFFVNADNYNSVVKESTRVEEELKETQKLITEKEDNIKELKYEIKFREQEYENLKKSFEVTKSKAIINKKQLLKKLKQVEVYKAALEATKTAKDPIIEQHSELQSLSDVTENDYSVLQNKTEAVRKKIQTNSSLLQNFSEELAKTCLKTKQLIEEHNDDIPEKIIQLSCDLVDKARVLSKELSQNAVKTKEVFDKLQNVLQSDLNNQIKINLENSLNLFSVEMRKYVDSLRIDNKHSETLLELLKNTLQKNNDEIKKLINEQSESIDLLRKANAELLESSKMQLDFVTEASQTLNELQTMIASNDDRDQQIESCDKLQEMVKELSHICKLDMDATDSVCDGIKELQSCASDTEKQLNVDIERTLSLSKQIDECARMVCVISFCYLSFIVVFCS